MPITSTRFSAGLRGQHASCAETRYQHGGGSWEREAADHRCGCTRSGAWAWSCPPCSRQTCGNPPGRSSSAAAYRTSLVGVGSHN